MVAEGPGKIVWAEYVSAAILIMDLNRDISGENSRNEKCRGDPCDRPYCDRYDCLYREYKIQGEYKIRPYGVVTEIRMPEKNWAELQNFYETIIFIF